MPLELDVVALNISTFNEIDVVGLFVRGTLEIGSRPMNLPSAAHAEYLSQFELAANYF